MKEKHLGEGRSEQTMGKKERNIWRSDWRGQVLKTCIL